MQDLVGEDKIILRTSSVETTQTWKKMFQVATNWENQSVYITYFIDDEDGKCICKTRVQIGLEKHRYRCMMKKILFFSITDR